MATGLGRRMRAEALNWVFNKTATQPGSTYYISAHTADPGDDGQTANEATIGTGSYARISVAAASLTAASGSGTLGAPVNVENTGSISFPASTAAWSTGSSNITHYGVWVHATSTTEANFIGRGSISNPTAVNAAGITLSFAAGALDMTLDDDT